MIQNRPYGFNLSPLTLKPLNIHREKTTDTETEFDKKTGVTYNTSQDSEIARCVMANNEIVNGFDIEKDDSLKIRLQKIEIGKDGDFAVFSGHPLNAYSRCEMTIIEGEVYFDRRQQPTAMTESAERRSKAPQVSIAAQTDAKLDLPAEELTEYAITGATLHPIDRGDIVQGTVIVKDKKITYAGPAKSLPAGMTVIDAAGLHIYPGMIDSGSTLGLTEIDKVRETRDYAESGDLQPDLRTGVAINPDSELFPVARAGGITTVLVSPQSGLISGQASLVQTAGWTAPEMVMELEAGLQIDWSTKEERQSELKDFIRQARLYQKLKQQTKEKGTREPVTDPRMKR